MASSPSAPDDAGNEPPPMAIADFGAGEHTASPAPATNAATQYRSTGILLVAGVLLLVIAAVAATIVVITQPDLSQEVARGECRTALEREASRRIADADPGGTTGIVVTVKRLDLQETYEIDGDYTVNGTMAYTPTSALLPQAEQSVNLTCDAAGTDDAATVPVTSRS